MATEVFVFTASKPAARRHRELTIERMVPLSEIREAAPAIASDLEADGHDEVRCWGSIPGSGNRKTWRRMRPGHWALLYGGEGAFPWLLRVGRKAKSKRLAKKLWGQEPDGRTWELMFFFDAAYRVDLTIDEVREAFAYEGAEWMPRGLHYPGEEHQAALLEKFGSFESFGAASAEAPSREAPAARDLEKLLMGGPYKGPPKKPPRSPQRRLPPDPDRSGRGLLAHEATVQKLERHIGRGFEVGTREINHDGAWRNGRSYCICEVKSITAKNEVGQLQKGLGQILHNRFKARREGARDLKTYLVAEREPTNSELWVELAAEQDVVFTWPQRFGEDIPKPASK